MNKLEKAVLNNEYIYSELFEENFKIIMDGKNVKRVNFSKGASYTFQEIQVFMNMPPKRARLIHNIKTVFGGQIR